MTNNDPDRIRADIERTRSELGDDVDALVDKVTPSKMAHRQTEKVKRAFHSVSDRVMGVASDVRGTASDVAGNIADAPQMAAEKTKGNPIAVGLIAFGVGWLGASLIPASEKEKELGSTIKKAAEPVAHELQDVAKVVGERLREPAEEAINAVKQSATDATETVKSEATASAEDVKYRAAEAKQAAQEENP